MKKKLIIDITASLFAVATAFNKQSDATLDVIAVMVEVHSEQPNIDDCIPAKKYICIALHPTDPSKDKEKKNYKW